jgi:flagellar hook protein FlgE
MGLFGSLFTSTSGMMAAARGTQVTSQNVANMSTVGYKRSDTAFKDIVANSLFTTKNVGGGVEASKLLRASQQGSIQQTSSTLDAGITGNGFFVVRKSFTPGGESFYTRNGQFGEFVDRESQNTYLRNSAGFFLYGWQVDTDGNTIGGGNDPSSLVPIEVGLFQTQSVPTSRIDLSLNLDAADRAINPHRLVPAQTLPVSAQPASFSRAVTVYDNLGGQHQVEFQFRKITGPMAQFVTNRNVPFANADVMVDNPSGPTPAITAGDTFTIANSAETLTLTFVNGAADLSLNQVNTVQDLRNVINNFTNASGQRQFEARIDRNGQLLVQSVLPSETLDVSASAPALLGSTGFNLIPDPVDGDYSYAPFYDIAGGAAAPYDDQGDFPAFANTANPNTQGWWEVTLMIPDPANPTGGNMVELRRGLLNFDGNGRLNGVPDANGNMTINLNSAPVDFDISITGDELPITVNITNFSQFANTYNVIQAGQNGAPIGQRTGIAIDNDGFVVMSFSNGQKVPIYRIPLATFINPDGLIEQSGTIFSLSERSGLPELNAAGTGGAGFINGSTLENSNVDIAGEFSDLIIHQRMFGLNSKVISTIDEMTQNLVRLKR